MVLDLALSLALDVGSQCRHIIKQSLKETETMSSQAINVLKHPLALGTTLKVKDLGSSKIGLFEKPIQPIRIGRISDPSCLIQWAPRESYEKFNFTISMHSRGDVDRIEELDRVATSLIATYALELGADEMIPDRHTRLLIGSSLRLKIDPLRCRVYAINGDNNTCEDMKMEDIRVGDECVPIIRPTCVYAGITYGLALTCDRLYIIRDAPSAINNAGDFSDDETKPIPTKKRKM